MYAFFEVSANVVRPPTEGAFRNPQLLRHPLVLNDFVAAVIDVIVENQLALVRRQKPEALDQAVVLVTVIFRLRGSHRNHLDRHFLASQHLANDETGDAVEIPDRVADVRVSNLRQPLHHAVDGFVGEILSVVETFRHKYPDQTGADYFIFLPGYFAVWIKPGEQGFERFFVDG
jgi:hypothetical protein